MVNHFIRVRDQVKCPASGDAKAVMRQLHIEGIGHVCIVHDIAKAHRRIPVLKAEWAAKRARSAGRPLRR